MMRFIPVALFVGFAVISLFALMRQEGGASASSPWIGLKPPALSARPLEQPDTREAIPVTGRVTVINLFASWCGPCIAEHPLLSRLGGRKGVTIIGIAWNDAPDAVRAFLDEHGTPYGRVYLDDRSSVGLALGIRGVPETFILDAGGVVRYHLQGPLTDAEIDTGILPLLKVLAP